MRGGAELVPLIGALQQLVDKDYTIKVGVCSYGSGEVFLTLVPTVPRSVVDLIVDHFTCLEENGELSLVAKRNTVSAISVANILETVQRMQK